MILKYKDKDYSFTATMKKLVEMNKKFEVKNFRDAFFKAYGEIDFEFLANVLVVLCDESINEDLAFSLMEEFVKESGTDYESLYKKVAEEINDKSFFGKKMSTEEMATLMNNPLSGFDINKLLENTAQEVLGSVVKEEFDKNPEVFQGYKG